MGHGLDFVDLQHASHQYVLLNPFRLFVTVNEPSRLTSTLIQFAGPLCATRAGRAR